MAFQGFLKQSTAVDVLLGPFVDETDGKTAETGLTVSAADVRISKNGQNMAAKNDATACVHDEAGNYNCELDATDTNTVGQLTISVHESGALPVRLDYHVVEEAVYDAMYGGSAAGPPTAAAIVNEWESQSQTDPTGFHVNVMEVDSQVASASSGMTFGAYVGGSEAHDYANSGDAYAYLDTNLGSIGANATEAGGTGDHLTAVPRVEADLTFIHGTALTETAGQLAGRFTDFFNQAAATFSVATALADFKATSVTVSDKTGFSMSATGMDAVTLPADIITAASINTGAFTADAFAAEALVAATFATGAFTADAFAANALVAATFAAASLNGKGDWNTVVPDVAGTAATPAEVATALTDIHLDHLFAADYDPAGKPGVATALLNEMVENDAGVSRFTANALELAPTGGSAPTVEQIRTEMDSNSTQFAALVGAVITNAAGVDIAADIIAVKAETALIVADTNELQTDDVPGLIAAMNNLSTADVDARLAAIGLDHLVSASVTGTDVADNSIIAKMVSKSGTADWDSYVNTTESLEAIGDNVGTAYLAVLTNQSGIAAVPTAAENRTEMDSNSTQLAAIVEDTGTTLNTGISTILTATGTTIPNLIATAQADLDTITGSDGVTLATTQGNYAPNTVVPDAAGTAATEAEVISAVSGLSTLTEAQVNAQCDAAIETYHLDHLFASNYDPASKPGVSTALLNELIEDDGGVSRYTANALEQASGTGATAEDVWTYATRVLTAGTNLNDLSTADVNAQVDAAIETYHLDHLLATAYDPASKPGAATALFNELIVSDAGVSQFSTNALENAPSGSTAVTITPIASTVDSGEVVAQHLTIYYGEEKTPTITVIDSDGDAIDCSAKTLTFICMGSDRDTKEFEVEDANIAVAGAGNNQCTVTIPETATLLEGDYTYALRAASTDTPAYQMLARGQMTFVQDMLPDES